MGEGIKKIIDAVILAETGGKPDGGFTDDPTDKGGRTQYGIAEKSNPEAWADGKVTEDEARAIYTKKYIVGPGFDKITDPRLQHFLVDWGVTSGPGVAIKSLQRLVGVNDDGVLGVETLQAVTENDPTKLLNRLIDDRIKMFCRIVQKNPSQARFISGWVNRALEFRV